MVYCPSIAKCLRHLAYSVTQRCIMKIQKILTISNMFLCAGETTENAIKDDAYETPNRKLHHSSKHIRPNSDQEHVETNQLEKGSYKEDKERDELNERVKTSQSEADVSDSELDTGQPETETSDDSEQDTHTEAPSSDDKSEKNEELKDGLEGLFQNWSNWRTLRRTMSLDRGGDFLFTYCSLFFINASLPPEISCTIVLFLRVYK